MWGIGCGSTFCCNFRITVLNGRDNCIITRKQLAWLWVSIQHWESCWHFFLGWHQLYLI
jgi:hypothetical protein